MKNIIEVKIVRANEHRVPNNGWEFDQQMLDSLEKNVNEHIKSGWVPYGSPDLTGEWFKQRMVKCKSYTDAPIAEYKFITITKGPQTDDYIQNYETTVNKYLQDGWEIFNDYKALYATRYTTYIQALIWRL